MIITSFDSRGLFTENSFWQAKQSILHITVTLYGDCVKTCEVFAPHFGDKKLAVASRQRTVSHLLFQEGIFVQNNMTVVPHPPYFSVSPVKDKTENPSF
jgi:hypothetical protein